MFYNILYRNGKKSGDYQCDVDDFKKLWRVDKDNIQCAICKFEDGTTYIYSRTNRNDRYVKSWNIITRSGAGDSVKTTSGKEVSLQAGTVDGNGWRGSDVGRLDGGRRIHDGK